MFVSVLGCTNRVGLDSKIDTYAKNSQTVAIEGWERFSFADRSEYFRQNHGNLAETYDELVGGLIDEGLQVETSVWLKPTYGNQNLLWTPSAELGERRENALTQAKAEPHANHEIYKGALEVSKVRWRYAGYRDKNRGMGAQAFQMIVFVCDGRPPGVSVFYWGDGIAIPAYEAPYSLDLLSNLSKKCK